MQKKYFIDARSAVLFALALLLGGAGVAQAAAIADPTRPSGYQQTSRSPAASYRLESVLMGSGRKLAIINGVSFSEGESTQLGKVMKINKDSVVIQGASRHVLKLLTQSIKQQSEKQ